jgi:hypothetical protein
MVAPSWHGGHVFEGLAFDLLARRARVAAGLPGGHAREPLLERLELADRNGPRLVHLIVQAERLVKRTQADLDEAGGARADARIAFPDADLVGCRALSSDSQEKYEAFRSAENNLGARGAGARRGNCVAGGAARGIRPRIPAIEAMTMGNRQVDGIVEAIDSVALEWRGQVIYLRGRTTHIAAGVAPVRSALPGGLLDAKHPLVKARSELFRLYQLPIDDIEP